MTGEELTAAITKGIEPLAARIEALEKRAPAPVAKTESEGEADELTLEGVAKAIRQHVRTYDIAARYGDDEFVIFLDRCDRLEAQRIVHRLSQSVCELQSAAGQLSLSAGIAVFPDCGVDMHSLIQRADGVLRDIRATGRSEIRLVVPEWSHGVEMQTALA